MRPNREDAQPQDTQPQELSPFYAELHSAWKTLLAVCCLRFAAFPILARRGPYSSWRSTCTSSMARRASRNGARRGRCGRSATATGRLVGLLSQKMLRDDNFSEYRYKIQRFGACPPGKTRRAEQSAQAGTYWSKRATRGFAFPLSPILYLYSDFLSLIIVKGFALLLFQV